METPMLESLLHTFLFVGAGTFSACLAGLALGLGLALHAVGLGRRPSLSRVATAADVAVSALEYFPPIAVALVLAWALVNHHGAWSKLLLMAALLGVAWSPPVARTVASIVEKEFARNY